MPDERQSIEDMGLAPSGSVGSEPTSSPRAAAEGRPRSDRVSETVAEGGGERSSGKATASLVVAILGLIVAGVVLGLVAIVLGVLARRDIAREPGLGGGGRATAGIVLGAIGFVLAVVILAAGGPSVLG